MGVKLRNKKLHDGKFKKDTALLSMMEEMRNLKKEGNKLSKYKLLSQKYNALKDKKYLTGYSYYLDLYKDGQRLPYEFLGIKIFVKGPDKDDTQSKNEKKRLAESIASQRSLELISDNTSFTPSHIKKINFFDYADAYIKTYTKKDVKMIRSTRKKFETFIGSTSLRVVDITPDLMSKYKEYLLNDEALSGETPNNYWTRFKKILRSAKVKGIIKEMPTEDIIFSNPNKGDTLKKEVLEIEELRILAKAKCGNDEVKRSFLFSCYTGLGLAEIRNLKWEHIRNGRLLTRREKTGSKINNNLSPAAIRLLGEPDKPKNFIFNMQNISHNAVNKNLKNWVNRTKIDKKITFYSGRHTFACLLLMNGANLKSVADAMGHSTTKNTLKYLNHVERLKDEATSNLPDIEL
ncbi:tyrosine-type recombinase/integrase [Leeuwenhoekiella aestuarii]|uniref:Site-specific recombinase XerD n=1 Tax=Leeuwenhoekiella aestuarii TaxID=2249426 RepID=A0A4Q0NXA8_9FLAO|nr:site-specific integrase [Leeuwenhoekiella aestuarii]RXG16548.1 site-specific recombinase XerD [Leeuwenhoekiella aestuarii]